MEGMAKLSFRHMTKLYVTAGKRTPTVAVKDLTLDVADGEFLVIVGPSGCGKTTLLRMIAGLEEITAGELYIGDDLVNDLAPAERDVAMVFQNYALYANMTARETLAFALQMRKVLVPKMARDGHEVQTIDRRRLRAIGKRLRAARRMKRRTRGDAVLSATIADEIRRLEGERAACAQTKKPVCTWRRMGKADIEQRVAWAANLLGITHLLDSKPREMSGGERQRLALGRAIVRSPRVMLMDEPLSNLDAKRRATMREEIIKLHESLGTTTLYVTHNRAEALTMGDRIVVMKDGEIRQIGTPQTLIDYPADRFVASFVCARQTYFFTVTLCVQAETLCLTLADGQILSYPMREALPLSPAYADGGAHSVTLALREEDLHLTMAGETGFTAEILEVEPLGQENRLVVCAPTDGELQELAFTSTDLTYVVGQSVTCTCSPERLRFFDAETGRALCCYAL